MQGAESSEQCNKSESFRRLRKKTKQRFKESLSENCACGTAAPVFAATSSLCLSSEAEADVHRHDECQKRSVAGARMKCSQKCSQSIPQPGSNFFSFDTGQNPG
jgi:hypothetical protein